MSSNSLLDDASTLLMFSKGKNEKDGTGASDKHREDVLRSPKNLEAANAAAAALAAAATIPLPLKRTRTNSHDGSTSRRSSESDKEVSGEVKKPKLEQGPASESLEKPVEQPEGTTKRKPDQWPVSESYIVDIDAGIITCVCDFDDNDGFTIQCDHCNRWQHASCFGIDNIENAPDDFLCDKCDPREIDVEAANIRQKQQRGLLEKKKESAKPSNRRDSGKKRNSASQETFDELESTTSREDSKSNDINKDKKRRNDSKQETVTGGKSETDIEPAPYVPPNDVQFKKEFLLTPKEAYSATYVHSDENEYKDKYVKLFIDKHCDDDWVIQYNKKTLKTVPIEVKSYSESSYARTFPAHTKLGVFTKEYCNNGDLIEEFTGQVDFLKTYLDDTKNHYRIWGTAKNRVIFHPHWPLYIDARSKGNLTRFLRRGCKPNVELVTVCLPSAGEEKDIKFILRATRDIDEGEELLIDWKWDLRHPIRNFISGATTLDSMNDTDKYSIIHSVETIMSACDCGCGTNSKECYLLKVKRYSQGLYKSVKSKIKMNNRYKLNQILNQYQGKKRRQMPITTRLIDDAIRQKYKAPLILDSYHEEKKLQQLLKSNSGSKSVISPEKAALIQKSIATINQSINSVVSLKPYKYNLVKGQIDVATTKMPSPLAQSHGPSDFIKNTSAEEAIVLITKITDYDESKVNNITDLPIPVQIPIAKVEKATEMVTDPHNKPVLHENKSNSTTTSEVSLDARESDNAPKEIKHDYSTTESSSVANSSNLKKKLSFADYRKKLQK